MNRLLTILLLAAGTAYGQIDNPPTSVNIVDSTATGRAVLTATNAAAAATAIGLGTANEVNFNRVQVGGATMSADSFSGGNFAITATHALTFESGGTPGATLTNLGLGATNAVTFGRISAGDTNALLGTLVEDGGVSVTLTRGTDPEFPLLNLGYTNDSIYLYVPVQFATNVTVNGNLSVGSLTTTTPSTWALDATQTAADTNGVLALPSNANVIRLTNNTAISGVSGGVLGAFYYLVNQTTNAVTISNVGGITVQGGTPLTLGANQAATLVATGATNASVAARGDLNDVALGGTANTAPSQTASSGASLMTRDLVDTAELRTFNKYATYEVFNFTTNILTAIGGTASPNNYTGTSGALPSWAYAPAAVDGATNHQALRHQYGALSKGNRSFKNWSKRNVFAVRIQDIVLGAGTVRIYYGPIVATWAGGSLAVKGLGFELVGNNLYATVHNGTTNTTSSAFTTTDYNAYNLLMESDGAGGVRWWVDGVEQTALTGGPTGNGGEDSHGIVTEAINPTPYVADTVLWIEAIQLISEL